MKRRRRVGPGSSIAGRGRTRVAIGIRSVFAVFSVCAVTIAAPGSHAFAGTTSPNTAHAGRGGGRFVIDSADLQYFVALNGNDTKDDAASREDFPSFNRQVGSGAFSGPEGTASAKSKEVASVTDIVTGDFETATATAEISGSAHRDDQIRPGIPLGDASAEFTLDVGVTGPTPMTVSVTLTASNNDQDECTEATASLDVGGTILEATKQAGGGCQPSTDPTSISFSGTVTDGLDLGVDVDGAASADAKGSTKSFSGGFDVRVTAPDGECTEVGTPDADHLVGTDGPDVFCGNGGADQMRGFGGDDVFFGGDDVDTILGGEGDDTIHGAGGNDVLNGGIGDDEIFGDAGCDQIDGGPDDDGISGGDEPPGAHLCDALDGGAGDDNVFGERGSNLLIGNEGNDTLVGGPNSDVILDTSGPNARLDGGGARDGICGSPDEDTISGGAGDDILTGNGSRDTITGGAGGDDISGGPGQFGLDGQNFCPQADSGIDFGDVIDGGPGEDDVTGGDGGDNIKGGPAIDHLFGEANEDTLIGGPGRDLLNGGDEDDTLNACDGGQDTLIGGDGTHDRGRVDALVDIVHADVEIRSRCA